MTTKLTPTLCLALWRKACEYEIGIAIPVSDIDLARPMMYTARKEANEPELDAFMLCVPSTQDELWLVRKTVELP